MIFDSIHKIGMIEQCSHMVKYAKKLKKEEGVYLNVNNPAGFWNRFGSALVDGIILSIVISLISAIVYGGFKNEGYNPIDLLSALYYLIVPVIWSGYTIGRKVAGNRIVKLDGSNVTIGTMLMRYLVAGFVYIITFGIAFICSVFMVAIREDKRAVHDFIAKTYVTKNTPE
ncbi:RDD family protein [Aquibacillus salsiterrae]|uniref:RDD family protein n=1 Tax=Aquibacillus salsiterrae TaxID=2950439 RepID=A0A9X3WHD6_9BACI|nr:RDD family protein [Aquibacillus salsiterrae]MDC3418461.1 RDD family protein [Aquibacillus salsiterrae]